MTLQYFILLILISERSIDRIYWIIELVQLVPITMIINITESESVV